MFGASAEECSRRVRGFVTLRRIWGVGLCLRSEAHSSAEPGRGLGYKEPGTQGKLTTAASKLQIVLQHQAQSLS